jgi:flagellar M-ring protein FliF
LAEFIKSILKRTRELFQKTEKKKLILLTAAAVVVIAAGIVGAVLLNRVTYTALYSGLSAEEAGSIMTLLKEQGVTAKAEGTDTILVPEDEADELRIELAAQGYPNTGLNYDLFSNSSDIGSTDLERQTYLQYQLQENMRKTICRMSKVKDCIVIVNLATSSSFVVSNNVTEASVAVLLSLEAGEKLTSAEAKTIGEFVVKCVPKLETKNVSIVDSEMNYYDIVSEDGAASAVEYSDTQQQLTERMKEILTEQALRVLEPAIGGDNVAVSVNLSLDFDKETVNSVEFSPPVEGETQGMLISSEEHSDTTASGASGASGAAGTDSNGVSASQYVSDSAGDKTSASNIKTYNYELNKIQTQIEKAQGTVQDLSVAVLVNSDVKGIDEYLGTVKSLVAKAIGVDSDYVSVEVMPFVGSAGETEFDDYFTQNQEAMKQLSQTSLIKTIIIAAALLLAVFMALKLVFKKKAAAGMAAGMAVTGGAVNVTTGEAVGEAAAIAEQEHLLEDLMIKKSDEAEKVEELMDRYPEAVVQILRNWLVEDN